MVIREARLEDIPAIATLLQALIAMHDKAPPVVRRLASNVEYVLQSPDTWYFVAETDDALVGMLQVNQRYSTWDDGHYGYIEDFIVAEGWRGRGVGVQLLAHVEAQARTRAWVRLDLDVRAMNDAVRLYERAGYRKTDYLIYRRVLV